MSMIAQNKLGCRVALQVQSIDSAAIGIDSNYLSIIGVFELVLRLQLDSMSQSAR
jgi:hypothetical protein